MFRCCRPFQSSCLNTDSISLSSELPTNQPLKNSNGRNTSDKPKTAKYHSSAKAPFLGFPFAPCFRCFKSACRLNKERTNEVKDIDIDIKDINEAETTQNALQRQTQIELLRCLINFAHFSGFYSEKGVFRVPVTQSRIDNTLQNVKRHLEQKNCIKESQTLDAHQPIQRVRSFTQSFCEALDTHPLAAAIKQQFRSCITKEEKIALWRATKLKVPAKGILQKEECAQRCQNIPLPDENQLSEALKSLLPLLRKVAQAQKRIYDEQKAKNLPQTALDSYGLASFIAPSITPLHKNLETSLNMSNLVTALLARLIDSESVPTTRSASTITQKNVNNDASLSTEGLKSAMKQTDIANTLTIQFNNQLIDITEVIEQTAAHRNETFIVQFNNQQIEITKL